MKKQAEQTFAKIIEGAYAINLATYSTQMLKSDTKRVEENRRLQQIFRSTRLCGEQLSLISGSTDKSKKSRKRKKNSNANDNLSKKTRTTEETGSESVNTSSSSSSTYTIPTPSPGYTTTESEDNYQSANEDLTQ